MKNKKRLYGLLGYPLSHSFSPDYFKTKFEEEGINDAEYSLFENPDLLGFLDQIPELNNLVGFNITIPFKQAVLPFLDSISNEASYVGAVNTVKLKNGNLLGYNTDVYGFKQSLLPLLNHNHKKALIFGSGGAAKAVNYVLKELNIQTVIVSRYSQRGHVTYDQLNENFIRNYKILINTTPLGMYPSLNSAVDIPYQFISSNHLCYDLIYNPAQSLFLQKAADQGATIKNGMEMLELQAERSWEIWNED